MNWKEIDLVISELNLKDAFLREIKQPDYNTLIFRCRTREENRDILVSLAPQNSALLPAVKKYKSLPKPPRFTRLLKSRIKNGRIISFEQINSDRIILMTISKGDIFHLYFKLWNNAVNIILCNERNKIIDAFSRRPRRNEIPGELFILPESGNPPDANLDPEYKQSEEYGLFLSRRLEARKNNDRIVKLKETLLIDINRQIRQMERQRINQKKNIKTEEEIREYRNLGDHIISYLHLIRKGDKYLNCPRLENPEIELSIKLDPLLTPSENASVWYKKASAAERTSQYIAREQKKLEQKLEEIKQNKAIIEKESDPEILSKLAAKTPAKQVKKMTTQFPGLRYQLKKGMILVGRTSRENETLFRHHSKGNDYWMHTRDFPGSHIYIRPDGNNSPDRELENAAAQLALFFSKARSRGEADLYYTQVKYLRKPSGGKPGTLIPTQEKNIYVKENLRLIKELEKDKQ